MPPVPTRLNPEISKPVSMLGLPLSFGRSAFHLRASPSLFVRGGTALTKSSPGCVYAFGRVELFILNGLTARINPCPDP